MASGALDGTTGTLTAAGLTAFPELKGPDPVRHRHLRLRGHGEHRGPVHAAADQRGRDVLAGVYQHPGTDPQAGVSELALNFDYNASQMQWLLLAPGLINWVTQDTHLGLYRNYFGHGHRRHLHPRRRVELPATITPTATDPPDSPADCGPRTCPYAAGSPGRRQMSAAGLAHVVN